MNRLATKFLCTIAALLMISGSAVAAPVPVTTDLWDISQGSSVTGSWLDGDTGGIYLGSDIRNMFGRLVDDVEDGNTLFADTGSSSVASVASVIWNTQNVIDLDRFILFGAADPAGGGGVNRGINGFNLYASIAKVGFDNTLWGPAIYSSGSLYESETPQSAYTIDINFLTPITAQYFKAEFIYKTTSTGGTAANGPRIIELDGYGTISGTPVPEPGTAVLLGAGLLGAVLIGRGRKTDHV